MWNGTCYETATIGIQSVTLKAQRTMRRRDFLRTTGLLAAGGVGLSLAACGKAPDPAAAATASSDLPNAIRIGAMGTWGSSIANNIWGVVQTRGYAEEEFAPDGVTIEWTVIDGGGNSVNEAVANGLLDFSQYGGLPEIIGKARGLGTRILASSGYMYSYLAVRSELPVHTPADLKGRTIGIGLGSYGHLATGRLLKAYIRGAHWVSLPENRESFLELGARTSTTPIDLLRRDFEGQELKERFNPLADDYFVARYRQGVAFSLESGIIRNPVDVDRWIDRQTVLGAIADLGLQGYWTAWDADGNPLPTGTGSA
jgi:ABC-type nitrate/sulfonate/bicarbonate transport system substrate-binding protein